MQTHLQALTDLSQIPCEPKSAVLRERLLPYVIMVWFGLAAFSYRHVFGQLFEQWQTNNSYSHGPLVIPIAFWLLWYRRSTLPEVSKPWIAGTGFLLAAHFLMCLGEYVYFPAIQRWTIPIWLIGMISLVWGRAILVWSLPSVCFLAFMIPLPFQLEMMANHFLQWASAWSSCVLLSLTSTMAVTDGYTLRMATGHVGITADCSGLRMTVAIAALSYVITFLSLGRGPNNRCAGTDHCNHRDVDRSTATLGRALNLSLMMLQVIPAAILANAARITLMAFVMDRFRVESYTTWAHDFGDWLVLPISAVLFLAFRAWLGSVIHIWRTEIGQRRLNRSGRESQNNFIDWHRPSFTVTPFAKITVAPFALTVLAFALIWHYEYERDRITAEAMTTARRYEANADWAHAADCYQELMYLNSSPEEANYRHAWVSRQAATNRAEREQVFFELEALLNRAPFHLAALRMHLDLSLELGEASAAIRSAERLYSMDRHDATTMQMCAEVRMRLPSASSRLPEISMESLSEPVEVFGPVSKWRDSLVIAVAEFGCHHPDSVDSRLTKAIGSVIPKSANRVGSAHAHFQRWNFNHVFGKGTASLDTALTCIDDECPKQVAYEIYLASANEAWVGNKPDDAKSFLKKAIDVNQADHRGFALLGDVCESQHEWLPCTTAYLRAWRLAGDRPLELGIKLAEALIRSEHHLALDELLKTLERQVDTAAVTPSRTMQIRLNLVQSQLHMRQARHEEALQTLKHCHLLASRNLYKSEATNEWVATIESLQAQCLVRLGRYADAARLFENRAGKVDAPADQWTAAARAWRTAGNTDAAAHCYRNAVFKKGDDSEIWLEYVSLLKDKRGMDEAINEVTLRQRRVRQDSPIADEVLAQAWEIAGNPKLAIEYYRSAAKGDIRDVAALAIALARQGEVDNAVELIASERWSVDTSVRAHTAAIVGISAATLSNASKATIMQIVQDEIAKTSDDVPLLLAAAKWYTKCQATSNALEMLRRVVTLQPENVVAANNLAMMLADEGCDFEGAIEHIDNALKQTGPIAEFLDTKGWILVQMNRAEDAIAWLTKAAEHSSSADPIAQLHLASAYMDLGDRDRAKEYLELARAGQIRLDLLNTSELRAWSTLQQTFAPQPIPHEESGA
ncbi:Transmembrane exosortase [Planctomycetes bacterium CA13]|uniref:Transmembrane exosortase n=1 Tax=Novipirellula herctigrandis TaxID=2527986 RepID=A0A5C5ZAP5_9BACT|nr:Transmembrane exosortase [Planctomycetes bacterium CA13]